MEQAHDLTRWVPGCSVGDGTPEAPARIPLTRLDLHPEDASRVHRTLRPKTATPGAWMTLVPSGSPPACWVMARTRPGAHASTPLGSQADPTGPLATTHVPEPTSDSIQLRGPRRPSSAGSHNLEASGHRGARSTGSQHPTGSDTAEAGTEGRLCGTEQLGARCGPTGWAPPTHTSSRIVPCHPERNPARSKITSETHWHLRSEQTRCGRPASPAARSPHTTSGGKTPRRPRTPVPRAVCACLPGPCPLFIQSMTDSFPGIPNTPQAENP